MPTDKGVKKDEGKETKEVENLRTYTKHMEKRLRNLETEKQLLDAERLRLEQELHSLRNEIDRLREPPLVGAIVISIIDKNKGRYAVRSSTGPYFVVNASRKVIKENLNVGNFVAVNQRNFAIMEILDVDLEDYKRFSRVIYTGQNLLEQLADSQKVLTEYIQKIDDVEQKFENIDDKLQKLEQNRK